MNRFFDFKCEHGHVTEMFVASETREIDCPVCGFTAKRLISTPRVSLDGISGAFPGAADKWVQQRAEKLKVAQSKSYYEGS